MSCAVSYPSCSPGARPMGAVNVAFRYIPIRVHFLIKSVDMQTGTERTTCCALVSSLDGKTNSFLSLTNHSVERRIWIYYAASNAAQQNNQKEKSKEMHMPKRYSKQLKP